MFIINRQVKTGILAYLSRKLQVSLTYFWGKWFLPIPRDEKVRYTTTPSQKCSIRICYLTFYIGYTMDRFIPLTLFYHHLYHTSSFTPVESRWDYRISQNRRMKMLTNGMRSIAKKLLVCSIRIRKSCLRTSTSN